MIKLKSLLKENTEVSFTGINVGANGDEVNIQYNDAWEPVSASIYKSSPLIKFNPEEWEISNADDLALYKWKFKPSGSAMVRVIGNMNTFVWWIKQLGYVEHRHD